MYDYEKERAAIFTEPGVAALLKIRSNIDKHIRLSGAVDHAHATEGVFGNTWTQLACLDYLVEQGEIVKVSPADWWAQHAIYTRKPS